MSNSKDTPPAKRQKKAHFPDLKLVVDSVRHFLIEKMSPELWEQIADGWNDDKEVALAALTCFDKYGDEKLEWKCHEKAANFYDTLHESLQNDKEFLLSCAKLKPVLALKLGKERNDAKFVLAYEYFYFDVKPIEKDLVDFLWPDKKVWLRFLNDTLDTGRLLISAVKRFPAILGCDKFLEKSREHLRDHAFEGWTDVVYLDASVLVFSSFPKMTYKQVKDVYEYFQDFYGEDPPDAFYEYDYPKYFLLHLIEQASAALSYFTLKGIWEDRHNWDKNTSSTLRVLSDLGDNETRSALLERIASFLRPAGNNFVPLDHVPTLERAYANLRNTYNALDRSEHNAEWMDGNGCPLRID